MADTDKKKRFSPVQRFFIILILIILFLVFLQRIGVPIVYKTEDTEMIEDPHPGY